ncbi:damage-inducible protein DinB [bacterium]|nr:damage-inducible protein DinB [bacterium]
MKDHFQDVFRHMEWADALVWNAVLASTEAVSEEYVLDTLKHIHEAQHSFLDFWIGRPLKRTKRSDIGSATDLMEWAKRFHSEAPAALDQKTETDFNLPSVLPWARYYARTLGFEPQITTLGETLHQLVSNSMHHRGQIIRRLRELDIIPPTTDYIVWVWGKRPGASWPV